MSIPSTSQKQVKMMYPAYSILFFCIMFDLIDYFGGAIPILGDIIDIIFTVILLYITRDFISIFTLIELIPAIDLFPTYTLYGIYLLIQTSNGGLKL